jgi:hypothetical protein
MPTVFKNFATTVTTGLTDAYTCPAGTTAIVTFFQTANYHATNVANITAVMLDVSQATEFEIIRELPIPVQSAVGLLSGKLVLEAGDKLRVRSTVASTLRVLGSVTEVS